MNEKLKELNKELDRINQSIEALKEEKRKVNEEIVSIKISPFKVGDTVLCNIPSGRSVKLQKCIIEIGGVYDDTAFVRPIKANGELSGRHYLVVDLYDSNVSATDVFKKCEEERV